MRQNIQQPQKERHETRLERLLLPRAMPPDGGARPPALQRSLSIPGHYAVERRAEAVPPRGSAGRGDSGPAAGDRPAEAATEIAGCDFARAVISAGEAGGPAGGGGGGEVARSCIVIPESENGSRT